MVALAIVSGLALPVWFTFTSGSPAQQAMSEQQLGASISSEVSWGSAKGCTQDIQTDNFGALTPNANSPLIGPFDASPHLAASIDSHGDHVWVGCVTSNATLDSIVARGVANMSTASGASLATADVALGITNQPAGQAPAGCAISAGQSQDGSCTLPDDGTTRTLLTQAPAGTTELDWQYQLDLPANQPTGEYAGGEIVFTASAGEQQSTEALGNITAPAISPTTPYEDSQANVSNGSWSATPISFSYQWQDCDSSGSSCSAISGATSSTYIPIAADVGHTLRVLLTAVFADSQESIESPPSEQVLIAAPQNTVLPSVTGTLEEGQPLTANNGTWTGSPTSFSYQWEDCNLGENPCGPISGATASTYTPTSTYVGKYIRVIVTAQNAGGSMSATSYVTGEISGPTPVSASPPVLSTSTPIANESMTVSNGSWTNSPTGYAYQWVRCDSLGQSCQAIGGATSRTYTPSESDVGHTLIAEVTASNAIGSATAATASSSIVLAPKPQNTVLPSVTGSVFEEGVPLGVNNGTWSGSPTSFSYQWGYCKTIENQCGTIGGATGSTYTPTSADVGLYIRVTVSAKNGSGETSATSHITGKISGPAPVNTTLPALSTNTPIAGVSMTVSKGSWTNSPTSYAYQWERCNSSGENCAAISGATSSSYIPVTGDVGQKLLAEVTATNSIGSGKASTTISNEVLPPKPQNTVLPSVTGTLEEGQPLTANNGTWTGSPTSFSYQWEDCNLGENPCGPISGATASTYTPTSTYVGKYIRVIVTAHNGSGETSVTSRAVGKILEAVPAIVSYPTLSTTTPIEGVSLSVAHGSWSDSPTSYSYQWERCNGSGEDCSAISGATSSSYTPISADVASTLVALVTATNTTGSSTPAASSASSQVKQLPVNTAAPALSTSSPVAGTAMSVSAGSWEGYPDLFTYTYQWLRCSSTGESCAAISGATSATYTPVSADVGHELKAEVSATNTAGITPALSGTTKPVLQAAPSNTELPVISNNAPEQGMTDSVSTGIWSNSPASYSYQWEDCNGSGASCTNISGASASSYTPVEADVGHTLRALVTATNSTGSSSATSAATQTVSAAQGLVYSTQVGSTGPSGGQFEHPADIAIDSKGNLWVADSGNDRIEEFNEKGEFTKAFGSAGSGNGQLDSPYSLAVDSHGNVWVDDSGNTRIEEFNEKGEYVRAFGSSGTGNGQFASPGPEGITVDSHGDVWVSDTYAGRVEEFNEKGEFTKAFGTEGSAEGDIGESQDLVVNSSGDVYLADWPNDRIDEFNENGTFIRDIASTGSSNGQLKNPYGMALESNGDVWVVDTGNDRVQKFSPTGEYLSQFGSSGSGAGQFSFSYPVGVAVDAKGDVWVTNPGQNTLEKWVP